MIGKDSCSMIGCKEKRYAKFKWQTVTHEFCALHSGFIEALLSFEGKPEITSVTDGISKENES